MVAARKTRSGEEVAMAKRHAGPTFSYRHEQVYLNHRPLCPVCKQVVYSSNGMHPLCAAARGDEQAVRAIRVEAAANAAQSGDEPTPEQHGHGWLRSAN
jgi:hypothetical protein